MCALEVEEAFATAPDGARILYRVSGKGPFALVMPVPWGLDSYVQTRGFSSLGFYMALVTFDPRGVGGSDPVRSEDEFSRDATVRDAAAVADAVGLPRSVVLGHSGGGAVALTYALRYPDRVSHLVLLSTAAWWSDPSPLRTDRGFPATEEAMRERMRDEVARSVRRPEIFAHAMDELLPRMRFSPERLKWVVTVGANTYDVRQRLEEIRVPTLIVHGRDDVRVPLERAEEVHRGIAGSRLVVLDDCGHWPHVEKRSEFVSAVKEFLGLEDRPQKYF
ncbi:MAG TPA: alpha/beta hydrolase [Thermoplasmata archaeon]|nr:alpha/beta hydrolase [Thermoplasmata archaeon]